MREYRSTVPSQALGRPQPEFSAPPTAREPTPEQILSRAHYEGEWLVPVEMVLGVTTSVMKAVVMQRRAEGTYPKPTARVIARGDRYFATIFFEGRPDLFLPLDCWSWGDWP